LKQKLAISLQVDDENWYADCPVPIASFVANNDMTTSSGLAYVAIASMWKVSSLQVKCQIVIISKQLYHIKTVAFVLSICFLFIYLLIYPSVVYLQYQQMSAIHQ